MKITIGHDLIIEYDEDNEKLSELFLRMLVNVFQRYESNKFKRQIEELEEN